MYAFSVVSPYRSTRPGFAIGAFVPMILIFVSVPIWAQDKSAGARPRGSIVHADSKSIARIPPADPAPSYRRPDPSQILAPPGYEIEVFASFLDFPVDIAFSAQGDAYIAESGFHGFGTGSTRAPAPQIIQIRSDGTKRTIYDSTVPIEQIRKAETSSEMPEGLIPPIKGITWRDGKLYIAHRSRISVLDLEDDNPNTRFKTIVNGLPEWGVYVGGKPIFDKEGRLVFSVATQGNAGLIDERWTSTILYFNKLGACEIPGENIELAGTNFDVALDQAQSIGMFSRTPDEAHTVEIEKRTAKVPYEHEHRLQAPKGNAQTGPYMPLWTRGKEGQKVQGQSICNGAFFRCNPDGSNLERIAWGFRSSFGYRFSPEGRLICTHNGVDSTPPRGVLFDNDCFYEVRKGEWYGWPDFFSGIPCNDSRFSYQDTAIDFILTLDSRRTLLKGKDRPRQPLLRLPPHVGAQGIVFGRSEFGIDPNQILVAEMGAMMPMFKGGKLLETATEREERSLIKALKSRSMPPDTELNWPGYKVQLIDLDHGKTQDFLVNEIRGPATAARGGGLERPLQLEWGPDGALYVVDLGVISVFQLPDSVAMNAHVRTGTIWRIRRSDAAALRGIP